ncbi:ABC-F family ATP-binding cassette domain-containing protein [Paenibacillus sp. Z6-24]
MTTIARVRNLAKDWNGKMIFEQVNLQVESEERLALIGLNGSGKTTLIRILMGEEHPTEGTVERMLPLEHWDWMRQQEDEEDMQQERTVLEVARQGKRELWSLRTVLDHYEQQLNDPDILQFPDRYNEVLEQYGMRMEQYEQLQGFQWEVEVEKQLTQIGIGKELWFMPYSSLSDGQKTRVRLAAVLTRDTRLLILDEPTNHLDIETMEWLEQRLREYTGALLFVSHDREFVDRLATSICELTSAGMTTYRGGYREYRAHKEQELRTQEAMYKKQEQQRKALEQSIRRYRDWFNKAHDAAGEQSEAKITASYYKAKAKKNISRYHAKEKELERLEAERVDKPREGDRLHFELEAGEFKGHTLLEFHDVHFRYSLSGETGGSPSISTGEPELFEETKATQANPAKDDLPLNVNCHQAAQLFAGISFSVERGDRLAVTGANGTGKTTLLRLMLGQLEPQQGEIRRHPALQIGYFSQELEDLPLELTLLDSLLLLPGMTRTEAQTILGCFLFRREDVHKVIGTLSMGEQCRTALIRLYFGGANLLILDEPTNYLDIAAQEVIESVLQSYSGTIVLVSHDRMLVRKLASRLLLLDGKGQGTLFQGNMEEYEQSILSRQQEHHSGSKEANDERLLLEFKLAQLIASAEQDHPASASADRVSTIQSGPELDIVAADPSAAAPQRSSSPETITPLEQEIKQLRRELERFNR